MLDAELDSHLNNEKHSKTTNGNQRNEHGAKKIKSSFGESEIKVPRDREGSFEPIFVPKRHNVIDGLENIIISFYAKGMSVLTDLKARGVEDILITATNNLNGFTQTIQTVFPESQTQICIVHQIRNACKYVVWKDRKEFSAAMKSIYKAPNKQAAKAALEDFLIKWESKYLYAIKSWRDNQDELTVFFDFPIEIRKIIFTTHLIENLNGKI